MTRPTKHQQYEEAYEAYRAVKTGTRPNLARPKSIQTKSTVPVLPRPEAEVLAECIKWLKARKVFCDRHDCGAGDFGHGYAKYGIEGAGDIIGILQGGQHIEIECKAGYGGRLSVVQQKRMQDVRAEGGVYLVVHGVLELEHYMKGLI